MELTDDEIQKIQSKYKDLTNYQADDIFAPIDPMTYRESGGDGLLHIAADRGDLETIQLMLRAGADINQLGDMGLTPLHYAYLHHQQTVVDFLIENGASLEIRDEFGKLPADRQ
ncbi:ankyrin repeat domain-containing protein [Nocardia sp. NPDC046763]|uniref:ankyrin repeat domain-containing protein n=1 Tax=Nocardia sp. NPDC046763 TaxID=3155256 RepID=UPI0033D13BC9